MKKVNHVKKNFCKGFLAAIAITALALPGLAMAAGNWDHCV